ncbi:MAG: Fe-S-containing protein, partial [Campylobacteraceae bacterium]|nr:Fe-S-containing protein [Campylobacteraceae bacterium]
GIYLKALPKLPKKNVVGSITFRKIKALIRNIFSVSKSTFVVLVIINTISIYYDFYASKPPKISQAKILEPIEGEFKISVELLKDNKLHRFAYITDAGNKIRFFALNRFPDKVSPVAVFDACMICGDMGYIKNGDELICIACNVRIFLPSVGKEGGCNPIPFPYEFDGEYITIKLDTIEKGVNYFNEIVEKEVTDPVSGKKIINLKAPFSYVYGGKTYFFETEENYKEFMKNVQKYALEFKQTYWRAQGFVALKDGEDDGI